MNWLEIIEIRSACGCQKLIDSKLKNLIEETTQNAMQLNLRIFKHATLDTGFCIHLLHDSNQIEDEGSTIGIHLASAMKEFGMVNHTVWIEMYEKP